MYRTKVDNFFHKNLKFHLKELNFKNYQIKIADDYADYYWGKINPELIRFNE